MDAPNNNNKNTGCLPAYIVILDIIIIGWVTGYLLSPRDAEDAAFFYCGLVIFVICLFYLIKQLKKSASVTPPAPEIKKSPSPEPPSPYSHLVGADLKTAYSISEEYFNDLLEAAKKLQGLSDTLAADEKFCNAAGGEERIQQMILADVINSYTQMGHRARTNSDQGLGLLMITALMIDGNFEFSYSSLELIYKRIAEPAQRYIDISVTLMLGNGTFVLEKCLKEQQHPEHNQYVVLLYRFASLVAKADKQESECEKYGLNQIMGLKLPEPEEMESPLAPTGSGEQQKETSALEELDALIGLTSVKSEISTLTNYIKVQQMRTENGLKVSPISYHCVFTGNPGTGKTTVARIVSGIYRELGILKRGHLVETDRSGLVAEYVGQTAVKTNRIIDSALDGILFIDEAYALVDGGSADYGKEAISTLLKRMEDERDRLVVILAGYSEDMKRFIDSNPGLQSRFSRYIEFPDYSVEELAQIFEFYLKKYDYKLTDGAESLLKKILEEAVEGKGKSFGNGRFVRNLFEKVIENQANRLSPMADISADSLRTIAEQDLL